MKWLRYYTKENAVGLDNQIEKETAVTYATALDDTISSTPPGILSNKPENSGTLNGLIQTKGANTQNAKITVFDHVYNLPVKTILSGTDGAWAVDGLNKNSQYFVLAENPDNIWESMVSSRRTPG